MLRRLGEISGCVIVAEDGDVGRCCDFLIDDRMWIVRYLVANTAKWLPGREVLVSPDFLERPEWSAKRLPVRMTREQFESCPPLEEHAPVSRVYEARYRDHYSMPYYWAPDDMGGAFSAAWGAMHPIPLPDRPAPVSETPPEHEIRLRSMNELAGYRIVALDGVIGDADDFLVDDETWVVRYLVIGTREGLTRREFLISPQWIDSVSLAASEIAVGLTGDAIRGSPPYDATSPVDRAYEASLYDHYGRPPYWEAP